MNPNSFCHSLKGGIVNRRTIPFRFLLRFFWPTIPESIPEKGQKQSRNRNCNSSGKGIDTALLHTSAVQPAVELDLDALRDVDGAQLEAVLHAVRTTYHFAARTAYQNLKEGETFKLISYDMMF